jgi:hypothetical protein
LSVNFFFNIENVHKGSYRGQKVDRDHVRSDMWNDHNDQLFVVEFGRAMEAAERVWDIQLSGFPQMIDEADIWSYLEAFGRVKSIEFPHEHHRTCRVKLQTDSGAVDIAERITAARHQGLAIKVKAIKPQHDPAHADFQRAPMLFEDPDIPIPLHPSEFDRREAEHRHSDERKREKPTEEQATAGGE